MNKSSFAGDQISQLADRTYDNTQKFTLIGARMPAKCLRVYDGDTAHFAFEFKGDIYRSRCRLARCNAPEIRGGSDETRAKAILAKDKLADFVLGKIVDIKILGEDKYGRPLIDIFVVDGENRIHVNEQMIILGYSEKYLYEKYTFEE